MRPLNYKEIEIIGSELNKLSGCELQMFSAQESKLSLLFWDGLKSHIWLLDLWQKCPVLLPLHGTMPKKNQLKPWSLFLKSHFLGSNLVRAKLNGEGERCLDLLFLGSSGEEQKMQLRLFPGGVNFILSSKGKTVSYLKPKELRKAASPPKDLSCRNLPELIQEYFANKNRDKQKTTGENPEEKLAKLVSKKEKSIFKLKDELSLKFEKIKNYKELGQLLKADLTGLVPAYLTKFLDSDLTPLQNMQRSFDLHKKEKNKIAGTENRLNELEVELQKLLDVDNPVRWLKSQVKNKTIDLKVKKNISVKYKTIFLSDGKKLFIGSSAKDNSELIKSSKPWYLWLHLRDYPSAHAVIISEKKSVPSFSVLREASLELINITFGVKKKNYVGIKFDIIYCEVRHLKLLKGSLGKVTYTKNKNLTVVCK